MEPILGQYEHERAKAKDQRSKDWEWERYLSCSHVPHPKDRIAVSDYMAALQERSDTKLSEAHETCEVSSLVNVQISVKGKCSVENSITTALVQNSSIQLLSNL